MKFLEGARSNFALTLSQSIYRNLLEQTKTNYFEGFVSHLKLRRAFFFLIASYIRASFNKLEC